jgi:FMN phosphatase YigB (HAD superfamily)
MLKQSIIITIFCIGFFTHSYTNSLTVPNQSNAKSSTKIIAFDLHGVLFNTSYKKIYEIVKGLPLKASIVRLLVSPLFWYRVYKATSYSPVAEVIYTQLTIYYPQLTLYEDYFMALANAQCPQQEVFELIHRLKQEHYKVYILSNIGEHMFCHLRTCYPTLFDCFDGIVIAEKQDNYIHKPQEAFFLKFKNLLDQQGIISADLFFVDDNFYHCQSASKYGFKSIYFTTVDKLIEQLKVFSLL